MAEPGAEKPIESAAKETDAGTDEKTAGDGEVGEQKLTVTTTPEYDSLFYGEPKTDFLVMTSVKGPYFRATSRAAISLVAVLDESGSMSGGRIKAAKETICFIIRNLEERDHFAIVGYHTDVHTILPLTPMTSENRDRALKKVEGIDARGSTALCGGLLQGILTLQKAKVKNPVESVMLFTDGEANIGYTDTRSILKAMRNPSGGDGAGSGGGGGAPRRQMQMRQQMRPTLQMKKEKASSPAPEEIAEEAPKDEEKAGEAAPLPIVNSFGFGEGHNETLLQAIAEEGRGMYAFIENTDQIADIFAECLGGLVSTVAKEIKITVEAMNGCEIVKCMSQPDKLRTIRDKAQYEATINDLQSEEQRDLLWQLNVPKTDEVRRDYPLLSVKVSYTNAIFEKSEVIEVISSIGRLESKELGEVNDVIDLARNRIVAADAMEDADKLAESGKIEEARKVLQVAEGHIKKSKQKDNDYSKQLMVDLQQCGDAMRSTTEYRSRGGKMLKMSSKAHHKQRAVHSSAFESQAAYTNSSKVAMKKKFKK